MNFSINLHSLTVCCIIQSYWLSRNNVMLGGKEKYFKLFLLVNNKMIEHFISN